MNKNMNEKSMLINPFPHIVYKNNAPYMLDLAYRKSIQGEQFTWILTYVGDNGILYREENISTDILLKNFDVFCNKNKIVK
jgi:hypothetical protein